MRFSRGENERQEGDRRPQEEWTRWKVLLPWIERRARLEGQRVGLSPAGCDEVYGRALLELAKQGRESESLEPPSRLLRARALDVARVQKWRTHWLDEGHTEPATTSRTSEAELQDAEDRGCLYQGLCSLSAGDVRLLIERFWCNLTYREVAAVERLIHPETARRRLRRALEHLRAEMVLRSRPPAVDTAPLAEDFQPWARAQLAGRCHLCPRRARSRCDWR